MARNILTTLKAEHDALRDLFAQMESTTDRAEKGRQDLLQKIEQLLIPHAKWEETAFYPAFAERADRDGLKSHAEALLEHSAVENTVIPAVNGADPTTPEFAGRVKVFGELVDHHASEEEKTIFKLMRQMFSADELAQMDEDYAAWKDSPAATAAIMAEKTKSGVKAVAGRIFGH
jgi:hemerythrin-like domain-containing protein